MLTSAYLSLSLLGLGLISMSIRFFIVGVIAGVTIQTQGLSSWLILSVSVYAIAEFTIKAYNQSRIASGYTKQPGPGPQEKQSESETPQSIKAANDSR